MDGECALASYGKCFYFTAWSRALGNNGCYYCKREVCDNHNYVLSVESRFYIFCDECVANEVTIVIDKVAVSASKDAIPEYLEKCKRIYCLRTKRAL